MLTTEELALLRRLMTREQNALLSALVTQVCDDRSSRLAILADRIDRIDPNQTPLYRVTDDHDAAN